METVEHEDSGIETLPLTLAYHFLNEKGFDEEVAKIRSSRDRYKCYTSSLRRGKVVDLLEKSHLLDEFVEKCWRNGATPGGKRKIQRFRRILEDFHNSEQAGDEAEDERNEESDGIHEDSLRDYLSGNLSVIEPGLTCFRGTTDATG